MATVKNIDTTLRDLVKQNAALLELVAYGQSVYPDKEDFLAEHKRFVETIGRVLPGADFFVISAIEDKDWKLPVLSTFDAQEEPLAESRPPANIVECLTQPSDSALEAVERIKRWKAAHGEESVFLTPYVVRLRFGEGSSKPNVLSTLGDLDGDPQLLAEFLSTAVSPLKPGIAEPKDADYFRAFACIGLTKGTLNWLGKSQIDVPLLMETLMIFYQISWSHREIIKREERKLDQLRNQEMAEMYAMMRDPVERLVAQLQAAQRPLNQLQAVLTPVRGLFGSSIVSDKFYEKGTQTFKTRDEERHEIEISHEFTGFGRRSKEEQITLGSEQIAAVVLQAFGELENAKLPLWEYLKFTLLFGEKYKSVSRFLLKEHSVLFAQELANFRDNEVEALRAKSRELFDLVKYWFFTAGRTRKPMRADYLAAGLSLIFPRDSGKKVDAEGVSGTTLFWVPSKLPVDTLSGLEALCHDYGVLESASLDIASAAETPLATLELKFTFASARNPSDTQLEPILASCHDTRNEISLSRGNMAFALMKIFGGVPIWDETHGPLEKETRGGAVYIDVPPNRACMRFGDRRIEIVWSGPLPSGSTPNR